MRLEGRVALVTGAAQGIGEGISRVLARHGAMVALTDVSRRVKETAEEIWGEGHSAEAWAMDVTQTDGVNRVVGEILDEHGKIDILVNNAGIYPRKKLVEMPDEFMEGMFDVNIFGMFRCSRAVLPGMMERRYGKIINISSVTGPKVGTPAGGQTAYAATKSAVQGFTVALALETAQYGINVNCVMPGYIESKSAWELRGNQGEADALERMREFGLEIPWGRQGTPEEVGALVLFLASDDSQYITGTSVVIDGGNALQEEFLGPYRRK
ncbi:MAG: SDR family NAD(P)-dependent oxidoreductase [Candidatus Bathyarchaeota archaeon]|jgi:NAD(P)-dependent dehydrogenase (short-subunit alcohol dehydrogenase family)